MDAKTAVDRVGRGKQRDVNARFLAMNSHYVFQPEFCNPAAGWEKGQVEKNPLVTLLRNALPGNGPRCTQSFVASCPYFL